MRSYYENLYIEQPDHGHEYFKRYALDDSEYLKEYDFALSGNNYWHQILYMTIVKTYNVDTFDTYNLRHLNLMTSNDELTERGPLRSIISSYLDLGVSCDVTASWYNVESLLWLFACHRADVAESREFYDIDRLPCDTNGYDKSWLRVLRKSRVFFIVFKLLAIPVCRFFDKRFFHIYTCFKNVYYISLYSHVNRSFRNHTLTLNDDCRTEKRLRRRSL